MTTCSSCLEEFNRVVWGTGIILFVTNVGTNKH
jgi:hypothetical protein